MDKKDIEELIMHLKSSKICLEVLQNKLSYMKMTDYSETIAESIRSIVGIEYIVNKLLDCVDDFIPESQRETISKVSQSTIFRRELEALININNMEIGSHTADYILAEYLVSCLNAFDLAVRQREIQIGR
jgi:cobalamin biosynthesis Co2+ chelatase CbiK